jgi:hypothetical protein
MTHILSLAFADDAFEAPSLRSAHDVYRMKVPTYKNSIQLRWKEEMAKVPIFRQATRTVDGLRTSSTRALRYSTFNYYLERLGRVTGFEDKLAGYCVRRGTGNAVDGQQASPAPSCPWILLPRQ